MNNRWIVLDVSYLCWRLFHTSLRSLSHNEVGTGILYGFVRDMLSYQDHHSTTNIAFCFDSNVSCRKVVYPGYKSSREEKKKAAPAEEQKLHKSMYNQIRLLSSEFLPGIGYKNVFWHEGFEADDLIGSIVRNKTEKQELVIVSADKDLYQLLGPGVSIWVPGAMGRDKTITEETFREEWNLEPSQWRMVKAIAGCSTDDVPGCPGIGESTAAKFLRKELNKAPSKTGKPSQYEKIRDFKESAKRNLRLVSLPFKGTPDLFLEKDELDGEAWRKMLKKFNIRSLKFSPPIIKGVRRG